MNKTHLALALLLTLGSVGLATAQTSFNGNSITDATNWSNGLPTNINPGTIATNGTISDATFSYSGATVTQSSGTITTDPFNFTGGTWNLTGGRIEARFVLANGSSGGNGEDAHIHASGGTIFLKDVTGAQQIGVANDGKLTISGTAILDATQGTLAVPTDGTINILSDWTGSWTQGTYTNNGDEWKNHFTSGQILFNGTSIDENTFDGCFNVSADGKTLTAKNLHYATSFSDLTAGDLNGQDGWSAQAHWDANGDGTITNKVLNGNDNGAFVRAHNTNVLASTTIGETATITSTFSLGSYNDSISNLANFQEGVLIQALSHEQGRVDFPIGLGVGLHIDDDTTPGTRILELRHNAPTGVNIDSGTSSAVIANAATLTNTGIWTLVTAFTRLDIVTYQVIATIDNDSDANPATSITYTATVENELANDSDGGGILGGIQALPGGGLTPSSTPLYADITLSQYSFSVGTMVTTLDDEDDDSNSLNTPSDISLREAIQYSAPHSTITFAPSLSGQTITLTQGQLLINKALSIDASALPNGLTIDANGSVTNHRVLEVTSSATNVTLSHLTLINGHTPDGGDGGSGTNGGGILNAGTLTLHHSTLAHNSTGDGGDSVDFGGFGGDGGGIFNFGTLTLHHSTLAHNSTGDGGDSGVGSFGGDGGDGGGISNFGTLTLHHSTLAHNSTGDGGDSGGEGGGGGGISNFGTLTLHHSTLAHNSTGDGGDGDGGNGGGIFNEKKLTLHNSTISQNSARDGGGGVFNDTNDTLTLHSSLIAQNTATGFGPDISQRGNYGTNSGVNFIGDPTNAGTIPGTQGTDYLTGNALLAPLANYGGPTQTMRPLFGSPTIDAGGSTNPGGTDQRGFNRFVNEMLDIGAVEYNPATDEPPVITAFTKAPGFHPTTNPIFNVTFTTIPGLDYTLEHNSTLQGTFTPLGPALEATAPTMTLQVPLDPTQDFLRARRE